MTDKKSFARVVAGFKEKELALQAEQRELAALQAKLAEKRDTLEQYRQHNQDMVNTLDGLRDKQTQPGAEENQAALSQRLGARRRLLTDISQLQLQVMEKMEKLAQVKRRADEREKQIQAINRGHGQKAAADPDVDALRCRHVELKAKQEELRALKASLEQENTAIAQEIKEMELVLRRIDAAPFS